MARTRLPRWRGTSRESVRAAARELVGITDLDGVPGGGCRAELPTRSLPDASRKPTGAAALNGELPLREMGEALLHKSRDVHYEEQSHPAYERLVESLAPDEARILRLMLLGGPQAAVDVRTGGPLGLISSRLLAPGLNMIGPRAGCRYVERVPSYLTNLNRLGLIWFSRETLRDPERYQVLEAQPGGSRSAEVGQAGEDRPPEHPPDALRRGLLPRVARRRRAGAGGSTRARVTRQAARPARPPQLRRTRAARPVAPRPPRAASACRPASTLWRSRMRSPNESSSIRIHDGVTRHACLSCPGRDLGQRLAGEALVIEPALAGHDRTGGPHAGVEPDRRRARRRPQRQAPLRTPPTGRRTVRRRRRSSERRGDLGAVGERARGGDESAFGPASDRRPSGGRTPGRRPRSGSGHRREGPVSPGGRHGGRGSRPRRRQSWRFPHADQDRLRTGVDRRCDQLAGAEGARVDGVTAAFGDQVKAARGRHLDDRSVPGDAELGFDWTSERA